MLNFRKRKCSNPKKGRPATEAFLDLKDETSGTDSNAGSGASSPRKPRSAASLASEQSDIKESEAKLNDGDTGSTALSVVPLNSGSEVRRLDFGGSVPSLQEHRLTVRSRSGRINSKRIKVDVQEKYAKKIDNVSLTTIREKTCVQGIRPGQTQTGLYGHRKWLAPLNFEFNLGYSGIVLSRY